MLATVGWQQFFYSTAGATFELSGTNAVGNADQGALAFIKNTDTGPTFKMDVSGVNCWQSYTTAFNFDRNSSKYIRKVFNTNPQLSNGRGDNPHTDTNEVRNLAEKYFLGETFERFAITDPSLSAYECIRDNCPTSKRYHSCKQLIL